MGLGFLGVELGSNKQRKYFIMYLSFVLLNFVDKILIIPLCVMAI